VHAGRLRHRITIRRQTNTKKADTGGLTRAWGDVPGAANLSAEVLSINGREAVIGQVLQGISHFQITIRFRDDLKPSDQVVWLTGANRELNIHSAEDRLGTRQWLTIIASTLAPQKAGA
jgi:head-tail adaptor